MRMHVADCLYVHYGIKIPLKIVRGYQIPWTGCNLPMWVLETELRSAARAASILKPQAISPTLFLFFNFE